MSINPLDTGAFVNLLQVVNIKDEALYGDIKKIRYWANEANNRYLSGIARMACIKEIIKKADQGLYDCINLSDIRMDVMKKTNGSYKTICFIDIV